MGFGVTKALSLSIVFCALIYLVHSSIRTLEDVDFLSDGGYKKTAKKKLAQYRRAVNESQWEFNNYQNVSIKKCCKPFHIFNKFLQCVPKKGLSEDEFNIFTKRMILDENFFRVSSHLNIHMDALDAESQCRDQVILLKESHTLNYFITTESGNLVNIGISKVVNYTRHYCLDVVHEKNNTRYLALMLCPCKEHVCIQKCCPFGEYFSTKTDTCKRILPGAEDWTLRFHDENRKLNYSVNHFFINNPSNCSINPDALINSVDDRRDAFIQGDGSLLHDDINGRKKMLTSRSGYCVDKFSDSNGNSHTNGFYCKKTQEKRQIARSSAPFIKCCKKGMSLNKYFKCQKIPENGTDSFTFSSEYKVSSVPTLEYQTFSIPDNELSIHLKMNDYVEKGENKERKRIYVRNIVENYDRSLFCMDAYQGNDSDFGLIFSPCEKKLCIQKCCPTGFYYDLTLNGCVKSYRYSKLNIDVSTFSGFKLVNREPQYFLMYDDAHCQGFERQLYANSVGYHKVHVQENGDVVKEKQKYNIYVWVHTLRYCVDIFSDGTAALANGFYCTKQRKKARHIFSDKEDIYDPYMTGVPDTDPRFGTATKHKSYEIIILFGLILYYCIVN